MAEKSEYARVKINSSKENKAKGYFLLMTNGNTYSDREDEFVIERRFINLLEENKIFFKELPLMEE